MVTRSLGVNSYYVVFLDLLVQKSKRKNPKKNIKFYDVLACQRETET
jgi:hypothetical protein